MNAAESGRTAANAAARERTIAIAGARQRLEVAQLAHLNAIADAVQAGVSESEIMAELRHTARNCAQVMAGRRIGRAVQ